MRPEFIPPDTIQLPFTDLPEDERELGLAFQENLNDLRRASSDLSYALALFQFSDTQILESHKIERFLSPNAVWHPWKFIAVKFGGLSIRNWGQALGAIQGLVGRVPTWAQQIDSTKFRELRREFDERFPNIDKLRHSIAHPEAYSNPQKNTSTSGTISIPGAHFENVGSIQVQANLHNSTYTSTFEGTIVQYDLSSENAKRVVDMTSKAFRAVEQIKS